MDTFKWHKQCEDDISDSINDFDYHLFACILNNGNLVEFSVIWDEDYEGNNHLHINDKDEVYSTDDIKLWIEIPIK